MWVPLALVRSARYTLNVSGKNSELKSCPLSQVSVPMTMSGFVISRNAENSAFLQRRLCRLMFTIRMCMSSLTGLAWGIDFGDDASMGWPILDGGLDISDRLDVSLTSR